MEPNEVAFRILASARSNQCIPETWRGSTPIKWYEAVAGKPCNRVSLLKEGQGPMYRQQLANFCARPNVEAEDIFVRTQASGERGRLPVPVRNRRPASLASRGTPVKARHLCVGSCLVDKDKAVRIKIELTFEPCLTGGVYITASLFCRVRGLFLSVIFRRSKKRQSDATRAVMPCSINFPRSSTRVMDSLRPSNASIISPDRASTKISIVAS